MSNVMTILATTMQSDADAMRLVAQNVSSSDNVAYRSQYQIAHADFGALADSAAAGALGGTPHAETAVDPRAGTLKNTGEPLNLAIQGDAYFVVSAPQGDLLTRRGDFHLDDQGTLTAFSGDPVAGTEGRIVITEGAPQIDSTGTVRVGKDVVGHLQLLQLPEGGTLAPAGDGLFAVRGGEATPSTTAQVHQGFLETSNVQPVNEMVHLLQTMRHFEAAQRFVRAYDEMIDRAIGDLGKV
jgi:flagellar basal-body rod protein FlgG